MSVSYEQYVMDDIALGIVKEKFKEHQSAKASQIAVEAAVEALNFFGVPADAKIEEELAARIRHIETPLEPYSEEYIEEQLAIIEKAVNRAGGSTVFMKTARRGLREGYLYRGKRIDAPLDLSCVTARLESNDPAGRS
jgi:hypothetical protein